MGIKQLIKKLQTIYAALGDQKIELALEEEIEKTFKAIDIKIDRKNEKIVLFGIKGSDKNN